MEILTLPQSPKSQDTVYGNFKGVNFSATALTVDRDRAPYAENMIGDTSGLPEKRHGFKRVCSLGGRINGIHNCNVGVDRHMLVHSATNIYRVFPDGSAEPSLLISDVNDAKSTCVSYLLGNKNISIIMTGREWLAYDGVEIVDVDEIVTVPMVIERADGGNFITAHHPRNILTRRVKEGFFSIGGAIELKVGGVVDMSKPYFVEVSNFSYDTRTSTIETVPWNRYYFDPATKTLSLNVDIDLAPGGYDCNVFFNYYDAEQVESPLRSCSIATFYGPDGEDRLFISGNPDQPACDWSSNKGDPLFFLEENRVAFGDQNYRIMGYQKIGTDLLVVKEDTGKDVSLYRRSYRTVSQETVFEITAGMSGAGAVSTDCFASLQDEPMFLSRTGVLAITTDTINSERTLQNRSYFIDAKLLAEPNPEEACAVNYRSFYIVGIGENMYLLDNRHRTDASFENSQFVYDGYYWTGVGARRMVVELGELYVGTPDGRVLRMVSDLNDPECWLDDGVPIRAIWETRCDDDDLPNKTKTMQKKGGVIVLKDYARTSATISVSADGGEYEVVDEVFFARMDFEDFNFDDLSFSTAIDPQRFHFNKKVKRYTTLQFRVENADGNEGFGVYQLAKTFSEEGFSKDK